MKKYILTTTWVFLFAVLVACTKREVIRIDRTVFSLNNFSTKSFLATAD
ncbi:hypothetical protein ACVW2L_001814 [Mucilaginibacter sp. HD30]